MNFQNPITILCEGFSERTYIQYLMQFLSQISHDDDFSSQIKLIPRIIHNGDGGGAFSLVSKSYKKYREGRFKDKIEIWVDADIYLRNKSATDKKNSKSYAEKKSLPDFCFSVMNFEDFLALHFPDDVFEKWYSVMQDAGHFTHPLTSDEYRPKFTPIWEAVLADNSELRPMKYTKGELPIDFISIDSLTNMIRHAKDPNPCNGV